MIEKDTQQHKHSVLCPQTQGLQARGSKPTAGQEQAERRDLDPALYVCWVEIKVLPTQKYRRKVVGLGVGDQGREMLGETAGVYPTRPEEVDLTLWSDLL